MFLSAVATDVLRARCLPTTYGVVGFYGGTDVLFVVFLGAAILCHWARSGDGRAVP